MRITRNIWWRTELPYYEASKCWPTAALHSDKTWHNCLVGCLLCQKVCPQNKEFVNWVEDGEQFSEEETALVLKGVPLDQLPADTSAKWRNLGLDEDYGIYPRNLRALLI